MTAVIDSSTQCLFDSNKQYFKSPIQQFQFYDKYARWIPEKMRRETWPETCDRVIAFLQSKTAGHFLPSEWLEMKTAMLDLDVLPSMRIVQMAGPALDRCSVGAYNCAYVAIDSLDAVAELLYILMQGTGIGYSVEDRYTSRLPRIKRQKRVPPIMHTIPDTTEGWCDALKLGLGTWFAGGDVHFDYSGIRDAGAVLQTKGGRASGPQPLKDLLDFVRSTVIGMQGKKLTSLNWHDICCYCGFIVQVGGVRRAALISLSDFEDTDVAACKNGEFWNRFPYRSMSNNSAVYDEKPGAVDFMEEWLNLAKSGTGERGIFNRNCSISPRRKRADFGMNPCFGSGSMVHTRYGHFPIESLVGKTAEIWDGDGWVAVDNFRITGVDQPMLRIEFQDGSSERVTPYHAIITADGCRVRAGDVVPGMRAMLSTAPLTHGKVREPGAYLKGMLVADGTHSADKPILNLYYTKYSCVDRLCESLSEIPIEAVNTNAITTPGFADEDESRRRGMQGLAVRKLDLLPWVTSYRQALPKYVFQWDLPSKMEFVAGLFDGDGTAADTANGFMYQLTSINRQFLLDIQLLLKTIGVYGKVAKNKDACLTDFGDGYGPYESKDLWRLTISQKSSVVLARAVRFSRLQSFVDRESIYDVKPKRNIITAVTADGIDDHVYCCTVQSTHSLALTDGLQWGQCGEIVLRNNQFCNLSIAVARENDTLASLQRKVRIATMFGTAQCTLTHFPYLNPRWKKNCEEERLLGVDITGQRDCTLLQAHPTTVLQSLKDTAIETNKKLADRIGINQSVAVTCVKPSGNSSQLLDCSSGLHPRYAPYYIRRVRTGAYTPVAKLLKDSGVPCFPETGQDTKSATVLVFEFPVKSPDGAISRHDMSAEEQFNYWLVNKTYYTEHSASCTIYVEDHEWFSLGSLVYANWDKISGLSFLPKDHHIYPLAPYTEISEEEYTRRVAEFPNINYARLIEYETVDETTNALDFACTAGVCEV